MGSFEIFDVNDSIKWNNYLKQFPLRLQDIYFCPEFYKLYEENNEGKAQCIVYKTSEGIALYPFLINSVNNLGFTLGGDYFDIQGAYGYNGVLIDSNEPSFIDDFYKKLDTYCEENNIIAEFSRFHPLIENQKYAQNYMQVLFDRETIVVDLTKGYDEIWLKEYSSKNRNMIRKAQKTGHSSRIIAKPSRQEIEQFISIYYSNMKMAGAEEYYYFNNDFFYNIFTQLKKHVLLINIEDNNGQVVCSTIFFHYGEFFHYHLSGRTVDADNSVNNFLLDEAVKYSKGLGAKIFHFGGGRSGAPDDSLLKFKSNFSKDRLPFYIGKKIYNQDVYNEVERLWEVKYPEKKEKYKNLLLKYRF